MQATNNVLVSLAAHGNNSHRAHSDLGGSTHASVNIQTLGTGQRNISLERLGHALSHSNRCDALIWVLDRQSNVDMVSLPLRGMKQTYPTLLAVAAYQYADVSIWMHISFSASVEILSPLPSGLDPPMLRTPFSVTPWNDKHDFALDVTLQPSRLGPGERNLVIVTRQSCLRHQSLQV